MMLEAGDAGKSATGSDVMASGSGVTLGVPQTGALGAPVHKIHELQERGRGSPGGSSPTPSKPGSGDAAGGRTSTPGPADKLKDKQRDYSASPPTQRHVHTHHHTHVVGGFPTAIYAPDAYSGEYWYNMAFGRLIKP